MKMPGLRGPYQSMKKNFFASNEVSTCSGCSYRILQLYDMCKGGLGWEGLKGTTIHQYLRNVCRKIALLKSFNFTTSKEVNSHIFWAAGLVLVSKEEEFCDLQSYRVFFQFSNSDKNYTIWNFSFLDKKPFFWRKKCITQNLQWQKKLCSFVEHEVPLRLIYVSAV